LTAAAGLRFRWGGAAPSPAAQDDIRELTFRNLEFAGSAS
jgi:hypothetical protein